MLVSCWLRIVFRAVGRLLLAQGGCSWVGGLGFLNRATLDSYESTTACTHVRCWRVDPMRRYASVRPFLPVFSPRRTSEFVCDRVRCHNTPRNRILRVCLAMFVPLTAKIQEYQTCNWRFWAPSFFLCVVKSTWVANLLFRGNEKLIRHPETSP